MAERRVEIEQESTFIPSGEYPCEISGIGTIRIAKNILSKDNRKLQELLGRIGAVQTVCGSENRAECPQDCSLAQLKSRIEFYIAQNRSDATALKD